MRNEMEGKMMKAETCPGCGLQHMCHGGKMKGYDEGGEIESEEPEAEDGAMSAKKEFVKSHKFKR
jgi:hypothetical protein